MRHKGTIKRDQNLDKSKKIGDQRDVAMTLNNIGMIHESKGEYEPALELYNQSLRIKRQLGNQNQIATILNNIAQLHARAVSLWE